MIVKTKGRSIKHLEINLKVYNIKNVMLIKLTLLL